MCVCAACVAPSPVSLRCVAAVLCVHSLNAFLPIIIKNMLAGTAATGSTSTGGNSALNTRNAMLLSAIPYATAAACMSITAWHSDRVHERSLHIGLTAVAGAIFWLCFGPMYQLSFAAGFVSVVLALGLAYAQVGVMYARVSGTCVSGSEGCHKAAVCFCCFRQGGTVIHVLLSQQQQQQPRMAVKVDDVCTIIPA